MTREEAIKILKSKMDGHTDTSYEWAETVRMAIQALEQKPKTGHWSRKTKVDAYDIAGVKTWGIKCQCDRCDFTTIVVEDFGYYNYCPNCGCRMVDPQESEDKE